MGCNYKKTNTVQFLRVTGKNKERLLLFLPGLGAYKENYIEFAISVSKHYREVYLIDLPQQGSKGKWTIGNMIDNLKEFINYIDDESVTEIHLAGHSAGAVAIISYLLNINSKVEQEMLNNEFDFKQAKAYDTIHKLGFCNDFDESKKITHLFLYAPCDSFQYVMPKKIIGYLKNLKRESLKTILNIVVNKPMTYLNVLKKNNYFNFKVNSTETPQYYSLQLNNYYSFFDYIYNYKCIFELYDLLNATYQTKASRILSTKKILIQFGGIDWLLFSVKRSKTAMIKQFMLDSSIRIIEHRTLGHFLSNSLSFDINLNNQMITNKKVLSESLNFIQVK